MRVKELLARPGLAAASWIGCLFDYQRPVLGFSRSEQRVLPAALTGATDEQMSSTLGASVPAIKKAWASIYRRVADHLPELVRDNLRSDVGGAHAEEKKEEIFWPTCAITGGAAAGIPKAGRSLGKVLEDAAVAEFVAGDAPDGFGALAAVVGPKIFAIEAVGAAIALEKPQVGFGDTEFKHVGAGHGEQRGADEFSQRSGST